MIAIAIVIALLAQSTAEPEPVTWAGEIAGILQANCASCHRPGESAPFSLLTYEEARRRAPMIALVTAERWMPPWHPAEDWGEFADDPRLSPEDIAAIGRWADAGAPLGDPALAPEPPEFASGWALGEPDLVLTTTEDFVVPAAGADIYRNFVLPLSFAEDRWLTAIELRPSARGAVHHALYYADTSGKARRLDDREEGPGFSRMGFDRNVALGGWAVGARVRELPFGLARLIPAGADLVLSMHFHPTGREERERSTIGLYFAEERPARTLVSFMVPPEWGHGAGIDIPPGEARFTIRDRFVTPVDIELVQTGGHAHYLGRSLQASATLPDGTVQRLLRIPDWDFNWQGSYAYARPVRLPAGAAIDVELVWDNSAANPANPHDPPQRIAWGLESTDEMGTIWFDAVCVDEDDTAYFDLLAKAQGLRQNPRFVRTVLERAAGLDANGDGMLTPEELPAPFRKAVARFDLDGDGQVALAELRRLLEAIVVGERPPAPVTER